jgi:hypothetical protein
MFAKFFIERPVLANVIALLAMLLGAVATVNLPVAQYPPIRVNWTCADQLSALADYERSPAIHRWVSVENGSVVASRRLNRQASHRIDE